jgi:hypothetical protein
MKMFKSLVAILVVLLFAFTGCMKIENRIIIQFDGSAVIKEKISVHKELLHFTDDSGNPLIVPFLEKAACENRAKAFGTGTVLKSHSIKNINGGVKVMEAEYTIPDINNLYLINPFLCYTNYKEMGYAKFSLKPSYATWHSYGYGNAGLMVLDVVPEKPGVGQKGVGKGEPKIKTPSPVDLQKYRNLQPVFKNLMKDFKVSVVFESYAPIMTNYGYRDRTSAPRSCEILSFSGEDYDNAGGLLLDNDEVMQELLRQKFWDYNFIRSAQDFANNMTVPVICDGGSPYANYGAGGRGICFKPSKIMFDKYFEGKILDLGPWLKHEKVPADFAKIGYDPAKDTRKVPTKTTPTPAENACGRKTS